MSELHNRLTHLVNYSSQLIFVSGDTVGDQQRILNNFLASQQENTEIAFFSASQSQATTDYRGIICRQFGGHVVGSFIRPLQQLLSDPIDGLSSQAGPYLVCITEAEYLEQGFLQELWDWVMHAQQTTEGVHLNVILFGKSAWTKQSQQWLPMQNSHKPVLLSSELVNPVGFDVHALEALMVDKSSWFSTSNQPMVSNKWFIGGVLSVFLVVFVGLMAWQYPQQIESLFSSNTNIVNIDKTSNDSQAKLDLLLQETPLNIAESPTAQLNENDAYVNSRPLQVELIDTSINSTKSDNSSVSNQLLVRKWSSKSEKTNDLAKSITAEQTQTLDSENAISKQNINGAQMSDRQELDFKVPDIISVEQLDAQFSTTQSISLENVSMANISPTTSKSPPNNKENTVIVKQKVRSDESTLDYKFDETTLLSLPTDAIVLQLSGIQNPVVLKNYLENGNLQAKTWVYQTQRYGGPWYVVVYRQSFESIGAALKELSDLPQDLRDAQPFAKSISQIKKEISLR